LWELTILLKVTMLAVLVCVAAARRAKSSHVNTDLPYFIASKRYEPVDFPEETEPAPAEQWEAKRVRLGKERYLKDIISDKVGLVLADMGLTSDIEDNLQRAVKLSEILDGLIMLAEAELRRRRRPKRGPNPRSGRVGGTRDAP